MLKKLNERFNFIIAYLEYDERNDRLYLREFDLNKRLVCAGMALSTFEGQQFENKNGQFSFDYGDMYTEYTERYYTWS